MMPEFRDALWLLALAIPVIVWIAGRRLGRAGLRFPAVGGSAAAARERRVQTHRVPRGLRVVALVVIVLALARPQQGLEETRAATEGIDVALVVDVSTSMLAEDFEWQGKRQNRLAVVKRVVEEFVAKRPNDRIGLVVFAGRAYTQCPMTLDHGWLLSQLELINTGIIADGTAVGSGIAVGLNRLRDSAAKSRVMVLLTDGVNNSGNVSPAEAAKLAKALDVKIYTIGAGTKGLAPYPTKDVFGRTVYEPVKIEVDDTTLSQVAEVTGGLYFRATDTDSLRKIYRQIDAMEKTEIEQPKYMVYKERFSPLVLLALLILLIEMTLGNTRLRVLP